MYIWNVIFSCYSRPKIDELLLNWLWCCTHVSWVQQHSKHYQLTAKHFFILRHSRKQAYTQWRMALRWVNALRSSTSNRFRQRWTTAPGEMSPASKECCSQKFPTFHFQWRGAETLLASSRGVHLIPFRNMWCIFARVTCSASFATSLWCRVLFCELFIP